MSTRSPYTADTVAIACAAFSLPAAAAGASAEMPRGEVRIIENVASPQLGNSPLACTCR